MTETGTMQLRPAILVVEDNPIIALDLSESLSELGFQVLGPFATVAAARRALSLTAPDHACLDLNAADELAFALARDLVAAGVRTTFLTGQGELARMSGIEGVAVLDKPISAMGLRAHFGPYVEVG